MCDIFVSHIFHTMLELFIQVFHNCLKQDLNWSSSFKVNFPFYNLDYA